MPTEDKRNTLIVALSEQTNQPVGYFQGSDDNALVGKGATVVFLREAGIRDDNALKKMSDDDQRNTLIVVNNGHTDRPISSTKKAMSNQELVQVGLDWFANSRTVAAILEFYWNIDQAKVLITASEIIAQLRATTTVSPPEAPSKAISVSTKEITNTSTFSAEEHGFEIPRREWKTKFTAGVPLPG